MTIHSPPCDGGKILYQESLLRHAWSFCCQGYKLQQLRTIRNTERTNPNKKKNEFDIKTQPSQGSEGMVLHLLCSQSQWQTARVSQTLAQSLHEELEDKDI